MPRSRLQLFAVSLLATFLLLYAAVSMQHGSSNTYELEEEISHLKDELQTLESQGNDLESKLSELELTINELEAEKLWRRK